MEQSADTLKLQGETNDLLKTAGYCPIPSTGFLDGNLCGARNLLALRSKDLFGKQISVPNPDECLGHESEWTNPIPGCFRKSRMPLSKKEWILIGGATSALVAVYLLVKNAGAKGA
jgi:hypothetical protein